MHAAHSGRSGHVGGFAHQRHFGSGFAAPRFVAARPVRVVPRTVFIAAPIAYFPPAYYAAPPPAYYYPPPYYQSEAPPPTYYEQPPQSYSPSSGSYPPPPSVRATPEIPKGPYAAEDAWRYRLFCPDSRQYYPDVNECSSKWLRVVRDSPAAPR